MKYTIKYLDYNKIIKQIMIEAADKIQLLELLPDHNKLISVETEE